MKGYSEIQELLEHGVTNGALFDELMAWLPDDMLMEFVNDVRYLLINDDTNDDTNE